MKEKGIIMSDNHPGLIQDGTKTMTRRVMKPQPQWFIRDDQSRAYVWKSTTSQDEWLAFCPYGQVGDRLWVRETFCEHTTGGVIYKADEMALDGVLSYHSWRPSIHMFRKDSRISLENGKRMEVLRAPAQTADDYNPGWAKVGPKWNNYQVIRPEDLIWHWDWDFKLIGT